jgi:putative endonuclease
MIAGFTRLYGVDKLVYYEPARDPMGALRREKQIKGRARVRKVAMIESINPEWNDLAEHWFVDVASGDTSHSLGVTRK